MDAFHYVKTLSGKDIELIFAPIGAIPNTFFITTLMLQPNARGNITLKNKNPGNLPIMSYDYYEVKLI